MHDPAEAVGRHVGEAFHDAAKPLDVRRRHVLAPVAEPAVGVVLVAAAANSYTATQMYPAAFPDVIAVAATDWFEAERVADKVRRLGLHNPRARSARYLVVRSAISESAPGAYDAEALIDSAKAKLGIGATALRQSNS